MDVTINWWGVLLAGISSLIIGALYYSPFLFAKAWVEAAKIDTKKFEKDRAKLTPILLLGALVTAYFIAYFSFLYHAFFANSWFSSAVYTSFLLFVGVSATTVIVHGVVDQRPRKLMYLTLGNRLLSLLAIGLIIGWLHP